MRKPLPPFFYTNLHKFVQTLEKWRLRLPTLRALQLLHYGGSFLLFYLTFFSKSPAMLTFIIVLNLLVIFHWYKIDRCILIVIEDHLRCAPAAPNHPLFNLFFEGIAVLMVVVAVVRLRRLCPCSPSVNVKKRKNEI